MKHNWFAGTLGVFSLVMGTAWTPMGIAQAISFSPPPDNAAPRLTTGGASRGSFFVPPSDNASPRNATGGASRGGVFTPPSGNGSPLNSTGGASRSGFFTPPSDNASPTESTGGASRGGFFTPPPDGVAPTQGTTGGASRGEFFTPPSDSAAPTQGATGGASRTVFAPGQQDVADAMSPSSRSNSYGDTSYSVNGLSTASMLAITPDSFYGTTLEARPTILVYVPASNAQEAIFSLKDEAKELVFQMTVAVPAQGGVIAVEMPESAPELAIDANYQWYVAIKLDNELNPASPFVDGWVKRIAPSSELAAALGGEGLADIEALGANGVWYDTAAQLALLNSAQADEAIAGHWYELLESVGLEEVATAPILM